MKKLHNCSLREQEGKDFIDYYSEEKPNGQHYSERGRFDEKAFDFDLENWEKSKQSIEVHPSQVEGFENLAMCQESYALTNAIWTDIIKQGIPIPADMVEIKYIHNLKLGAVKYAFLKQEARQEGNIQYGDPMLSGKCKFCGGITKHWPECELSSKNKPSVEEERSQQLIDKTFWGRLLLFMENVNVNDAMSEEEKQYIIRTAKRNKNSQELKNNEKEH